MKKKLIVLGASGMIGYTLTKVLSEKKNWQIIGIVRNLKFLENLKAKNIKFKIHNYKYSNLDSLKKIITSIKPDIVINCSGVTKQRINLNKLSEAVFLNSLFPHLISSVCKKIKARYIHISTDCVFSGKKGNYLENDISDAQDIYGKTKFLGEIIKPNTIVLRTSTIGHEIKSKKGLLEWFLAQKIKCNGFKKAIFSGIPTVIFAEIIRDIIIPKKNLSGLYHIAAKPINKFALLKLISKIYNKNIKIISNSKLKIDRSLDYRLFYKKTGYIAPSWKNMIIKMHEYKKNLI